MPEINPGIIKHIHYWKCDPVDEHGFTHAVCACGDRANFGPGIRLEEPQKRPHYDATGIKRITKYDRQRNQITIDYLTIGFKATQAKYGMAASTLDDKLRLWKIITGPKRWNKWDEIEFNYLRDNCGNKKANDIALDLGRTAQSVYEKAHKEGFKFRK